MNYKCNTLYCYFKALGKHYLGSSMKIFVPCLILLISSFNTSAVVIRHDKADELYRFRTNVIEAHVTFTTPHEGKDYIVGSGTYLGNGWVLTAAHVAHFFEKPDVAQILSEKLKIHQVIIHNKWRDRQIGFDIALVKIEEPKQKITPVTLFSHELKAGEIITIAGRGDTGNGVIGMKTQDSHMRVAENRVDKVKNQWLSFTFDSPENGALEYEGMCGGGDSGSPAYIVKDGITHVVGLSSWQDTEATNWEQGFYGAEDYYTYISFYKSWLNSHVKSEKSLIHK
jgi:secreted trypsin-like serine protease